MYEFKLRLGIFLMFVIFGTGVASCTHRSEPKPATLKHGALPFAFDPEQVKSLSVVKTDPRSGDTWSGELRHIGPEKADWEIASAPFEIGDHRAHGTFILHLLDTFKTLGVEEPAPKGPLGSYGLEPPRFGFRWMTYELRIGNSLPDGGAYAQFLPNTDVYVVKGAALQMIEHLTDFDSLRLRTLSTFGSDDVEEIELKQGARKFYAQRNGDVWADAKDRPHRKNVSQLIESLTHWRIERFLDDDAVTETSRKLLAGTPATEITVRNLQGKATTVRFVASGKLVLAETSSRKNSIFQVYPQIAKMVLSFF